MARHNLPPDGASAPLADRAGLVRVGETVRARLCVDPSVYRVPVDEAEIFAIGQFLGEEECAHLMREIDAVAEPSHTFDGPYAPYRTSYSGNVDPSDSFTRMIERRICDLLGIDMALGETFQGQRYEPGQEFKGHHDWFDTRAHYWPEEKRRGGQRSWTAMVYLNAVAEGGETEFTKLGIRIAPEPGALLCWNNALPDGLPNPYTLHAALPVTRGTKYVITKWFRTRPWR